MMIAVVQFPQVPAESEAEFREWFAWSNVQLRDAVGLAGRRLLRAGDGGYVALVEHESADTFAQMHASVVAVGVQERLHEVLEDGPHAEMYEVVDDAAGSDCCGGHHQGPTGAQIETIPASGSGGCCQGS